MPTAGWVRRGRTLRTPSGPRGSSGKWVFLGAAGLLKGRRVTGHPSIRAALKASGAKVSTRQLEIDGNLVTASDEAAGMRFGKALASIVGI